MPLEKFFFDSDVTVLAKVAGVKAYMRQDENFQKACSSCMHCSSCLQFIHHACTNVTGHVERMPTTHPSHLSIYLFSVFLSVRLNVCPSVCTSACLLACPSVCLFICPSVCLSVCPSVGLSVYPSHSFSALILCNPN